MKELHDLELTLRSHTPILAIESLEEPRILRMLASLAFRLDYPFMQWTVTDGLRRLEFDSDPNRQTADPQDLLKHIKAGTRPGYFVLLDFHPYLDNPVHIRLIKEIAQGYESVPHTLIFISHALIVPPEIRHLTARFELSLPDTAAIKALIRDEVKRWQTRTGGGRVAADREALDRIAVNLTGMTATDVRRLARTAIENDGAITHSDLPEVMKAKYELMDQGGVIAFEYDATRFCDVAGLGRLKDWLEHRRKAFESRSTSLDAPKGVMLLGVQGCGKSLAAKAVAGTFRVPLLRLDFGALYNKFYGETEKNLRRALSTAVVMSPCVLWMDEIEKGLAPSDADDGLSRRVLGTLLTWMAEHPGQVFIVATSNDIERLPPELVRKGRLDEIFFVDLPDANTRREIFSIHLRRRNLAPSGFDLDALAEASEGFSGAEIEQAVVSALYAAHANDAALADSHLAEELSRTRPLSVTMAERIAALRAWARDRTVPAH
jgi:SpoVK/Ycf46/Vps4 family AAA+-type ATPase